MVRDTLTMPEVSRRVKKSVVGIVLTSLVCVSILWAVEWAGDTYAVVYAAANGSALSAYRAQMLMMASLPERAVIITAGDLEWTSAM
jgi:hypothetical protein